VHLVLRAASQGHVLTVRRFFFRRSLFDLSYRTATEVTLQLPSGGDVSPLLPTPEAACSSDRTAQLFILTQEAPRSQ
jgi:hypothetical protein